MGDDSFASIPPELRVVLDLQLTVKDLASATEHQKIQAVLAAVGGIESVSVWEDKVDIRYDPEKVTRHQLHDLIAAEGFSIVKEESAPTSPSLDSQ